ncbi:MAG: SURF1 family protein [Anaerolineales bacterium]|nr:SURF1 family protein [Anaerolineales bacterium]MCW5838656.1 SURF1 family protein [Anaerolineales bacterium]
MFARLLSRRWLFTTLLVLVAAAVMVRLGIWQLDRLEWRRAFNARVMEQAAEPPQPLGPEALDLDLYSMEYRQVEVTGEYLPQDAIVLRNEVWLTLDQGSLLGYKLLMPLRIAGSDTAILVDRGWIPMEAPLELAQYASPAPVTVSGQLRRAETDVSLAFNADPTLQPGQARLDVWNRLDLDRVAAQMSTPLLTNAYLQVVPHAVQAQPPFANPPELDLSEGSHFGYAVQWFTFATILLVGYPYYARRQDLRNEK